MQIPQILLPALGLLATFPFSTAIPPTPTETVRIGWVPPSPPARLRFLWLCARCTLTDPNFDANAISAPTPDPNTVDQLNGFSEYCSVSRADDHFPAATYDPETGTYEFKCIMNVARSLENWDEERFPKVEMWQIKCDSMEKPSGQAVLLEGVDGDWYEDESLRDAARKCGVNNADYGRLWYPSRDR